MTQLKLTAKKATELEPKGIEIMRGTAVIGILYIDGVFVPTSGSEFNQDEMKTILVISENFALFYSNLKD